MSFFHTYTTSPQDAAVEGRPETRQGCFKSYGRTVYGGNPVTQQTLPAFFAYATPRIVIPAFASVATVFMVLGIILIVISDRQYEVGEIYSDIHKYQYVPTDPSVNINQGIRSFTVGSTNYSQGTRTRVVLRIRKALKAPVYLYYTVGNFFQNFRDFHNGRSTSMLAGRMKRSHIFLECRPFENPGFLDGTGNTDVRVEVDGTPHVTKYEDFVYHPCGLAPWSMFNDTFVLYRVEKTPVAGDAVPPPGNLVMICNTSDFSATGEPLRQSVSPNRCRKKGISWRADETIRFTPLQTGLHLWSLRYPYLNDNVYLTNGWYAGEPGHSLTDPLDYDMQVWVRGALLSNFRKLLRIIDVDLDKGGYVMEIEEFFDVTTFGGSKGFLLRTSSHVGREGYAMGIAFVVLGAISFVLGVTFCIEFLLRSRLHKSLVKQNNNPWYAFDPDSAEMQMYYQQRTRRYMIENRE